MAAKRLIYNLEDNCKLEWSVHLARTEPTKAVVVYAVATLAGVASAMFMGNPWLFIFGAMVILLSSADFVLPNRFKVNESGAERRVGLSVTSMPWDRVNRVVVGEEGVKLSPFVESTKLAPFRGVYLRANGNLQEIVSCVEYWRKRNAEHVGEGSDGSREGQDGQGNGRLPSETQDGDTGNALPRDA